MTPKHNSSSHDIISTYLMMSHTQKKIHCLTTNKGIVFTTNMTDDEI